MTYRQKIVRSMAFYLRHKFDAIEKIDAIKELKSMWPNMDVSDMVKAYKIAYE